MLSVCFLLVENHSWASARIARTLIISSNHRQVTVIQLHSEFRVYACVEQAVQLFRLSKHTTQMFAWLMCNEHAGPAHESISRSVQHLCRVLNVC